VGFDFVAAAGNSGTFVLAAQQRFSAKRRFRLNMCQFEQRVAIKSIE
jgi:hypothetical protein